MTDTHDHYVGLARPAPSLLARAGGFILALAAGVAVVSGVLEAVAGRSSLGNAGLPLAMVLLGISATQHPRARASKVLGWSCFGVVVMWVAWRAITGQP